MELAKDQILLLGNIAFMATCHGLTSEAKVIYDGLEALKPHNLSIKVGKAATLLQLDDPKAALELLEGTVLKEQPDNTVAKMYQGLAYRALGDAERSREIFQWILDSEDPNPDALKVAGVMMRIVNK